MGSFDASSRAALRVLIRRLGVLSALRVGLAVQRRIARGEPFAHLPPAADPRERASRDQAGPAFVLYRELVLRGHAEDLARSIVAEAVSAGAVAFLRKSIGPIRRATLAAMSEPERRAWVDARAARFPNAVPTFEVVGPEEVRFRVSACRFVALAREAGLPELAPVFCAGDARFFGAVEPDVVLDRPHTLAEGGPDCPFSIRFRSPS